MNLNLIWFMFKKLKFSFSNVFEKGKTIVYKKIQRMLLITISCRQILRRKNYKHKRELKFKIQIKMSLRWTGKSTQKFSSSSDSALDWILDFFFWLKLFNYLLQHKFTSKTVKIYIDWWYNFKLKKDVNFKIFLSV